MLVGTFFIALEFSCRMHERLLSEPCWLNYRNSTRIVEQYIYIYIYIYDRVWGLVDGLS